MQLTDVKGSVPSREHLLELIKGKRYKEYKDYITLIEDQAADAEVVVADVLRQIFSKRKYPSPDLMFNALVFYKQLLMSAAMLYYCQQSLFPVEVHHFIAEVCRFHGQQSDIEARGSQYFVELFGLSDSEQVRLYGYNFILLALQLLKSMALWCPTDYLSLSRKSVFKGLYDELIGEGIFFPAKENFKFIKEKDEQKFRQKYKKFKEQLDSVIAEEKGMGMTPKPQDQRQINQGKGKGLACSERRKNLQQLDIIIEPPPTEFSSDFSTPKIRVWEDKQEIIQSALLLQSKLSPEIQRQQQKQKQAKSNILGARKEKIVEKARAAEGKINFTSSPLKMMRTQRSRISPKKEKKMCESSVSNLHKAKSHKSLPKTESRCLEKPAVLNFAQQVWCSEMTDLKMTLSRLTLSQSSLNRKALDVCESIKKYKEINSYLYRLNLAEEICEFKEERFKPLTRTMLDLRNEALNLAKQTSSSTPFYRGSLIQGRLVKEGKDIFHLTLKNVGETSLLIGYQDMSQHKHSSQIRVLSWGGKTDLRHYPSSPLPRLNYLDIKFSCFVADHRLRFLPFDFTVNGKEYFVVLPITLLDMSKITNNISFGEVEKYAKKSIILLSAPFRLRLAQLPAILGGFQFHQFYPRDVSGLPGSMIGLCRLQLPREPYLMSAPQFVYLILRLCDYSKRLIQLELLYQRQNAEEEYFSEAVLQLLQFLLMQ